MSNSRINIYLASSWFTPRMKSILSELEVVLSAREDVNLYSPRRDGIVLPAYQKHDTALRESIFKENIQQIDKADIVLANIDSMDSYNDPGTIYEIGYAMAHDVPVVGFTLSFENIEQRFKGFLDGFECILGTYESIYTYLDSVYKSNTMKDRVLFVGNGNNEVDTKLASYIMDSGANLRWVNNFHDEVYARIDEVFANVEYMIAVVDDRSTLVSWMIGQAYARGIPVVTYSDQNYGINVMLLVSILTHLRGTDELCQFLQQVKRSGIESIPKMDISEIDSM